MFPRLYADTPCQIDGYDGYVFRVLLNSTGQEKIDWAMGSLGTPGCVDCAVIAREAEQKTREGGAGDPLRVPSRPFAGEMGFAPSPSYCPSCTVARDRLGRAAHAIYGGSHVAGLDLSTPEACLTTFGDATLPDELLLWLYLAPGYLWEARGEDMKKKLRPLSPTGS